MRTIRRTRTRTTMLQAHGHGHEHPDNRSRGHAHTHRSLPEIFALIDQSALSPSGRERAKALFDRLAEAEAAIHQMPVDQVHLHEVGALDSIIDIVGAVFAFEWLDADRIVCSPLNVGGGMVKSAHGLFPVPAPATLRLLGDAPIYSGAVQKELVTPTGALIATSYATSFGPIPAMSVERVGYGAGERDNPGTPNVLRILVGRAAERDRGRSRRRHRVRDRRHEPADLRRRHGSAVCGGRAGRLLRAGADEEEPARHAADGGRVRRSCGRRCRTSFSARRRPSACGTMKSIASGWRARS